MFLRRIFPVVYFVNTNLPEERAHIYIISEKELSELPDNSPNIVKKSNIGCHMEKPNETFSNRKYSTLNNFCYAKFLTYCTRENKSSKTCEYQPLI